MGDYKTVAAVTRAIAHVLREALARRGMLGEVDVTIASPHQANDRGSRRKSINLFLYHVRPTPSLRNRDLPVYDAERMVNTPTIGLDLYYLLSFYGAAPNDLQAEQLLGLAVSALNARPLLAQADFTASADPNEPDSGQLDTVAVVPMTLTIEEMQRLWAMFPNVPYTLSMSYCASSALLVGDEIPQPQPPVASGGRPLHSRDATRAQAPPSIRSVLAVAGRDAPILFGDAIRVLGQHLSAPRVAVEIAGLRLQPSAVDNQAIELTLDDPSVHAGQQTLLVLQLDSEGSLADARALAASNALTITLRPRLTSVTLAAIEPGSATDTYSGRLDLRVSPDPAPGQRAGILLNQLSEVGGGPSYAFAADVDAFDDGTLPVTFTDVSPGYYLVQYEVDGAASLLSPQTGDPYTDPVIEIDDA